MQLLIDGELVDGACAIDLVNPADGQVFAAAPCADAAQVERAVVAGKREGIIKDCHAEEGAVAGAAREAISQVMTKAIGLNIGGKLGIARRGDHVSVAVFFGVGLLHLDEVAVGLGHRAIG